MALPTVRIEAPGLDPLNLDPFDGWIVQQLDLGDAVVRAVVEDKPDDDGTIDTTSLSGARAVTLSVVLAPRDGDVESLEHRLKAFMNPTLRPTMFVTRNGSNEKRIILRRESYTGPIEVEDETVVVAQWIAPSGILESVVQHTVVVTPGAGNTDGLEFGTTLEFGPTLEFPLVDPPGVSEVFNAGDRPASPVLRAFGPFGDEGNDADETEIANLTTGESLIFAGTGIVAGDYLEIDVAARTIRVNGLAAQSRYDRLVFPDSEWFRLEPGVNEIAFRPDTFSGNAQMQIVWRDAFS